MVIGHQAFGDTLTDCVNLGHMTATLHVYPDVHASKLFLTQKQSRFRWLPLHPQGPPVDLDEPAARLQFATSVPVPFLVQRPARTAEDPVDSMAGGRARQILTVGGPHRKSF